VYRCTDVQMYRCVVVVLRGAAWSPEGCRGTGRSQPRSSLEERPEVAVETTRREYRVSIWPEYSVCVCVCEHLDRWGARLRVPATAHQFFAVNHRVTVEGPRHRTRERQETDSNPREILGGFRRRYKRLLAEQKIHHSHMRTSAGHSLGGDGPTCCRT